MAENVTGGAGKTAALLQGGLKSRTPEGLLLAPFRTIYKHRQILYRTAQAEIRGVHAGSVLGAVWLVLGPLMMLSVYAMTFAVIFRFRPLDMTVSEYVLYVFAGLVPFLTFSSALSAGTLSLVSNKHLLLNTVFPAELIPLRSVLVASVTMPVGLCILLLGDLAFSSVSPTWLLVPVVAILEIIFVAGICWVLSLVALLFRDIQQLITYAVMMLSVLTPIAYTPSMIPGSLAAVIYLNPLSYFVISAQSLILLNTLPPWQIVAVMFVISIGAFVGGYRLCQIAKAAFYDLA
ncbi:MAG: ABC transporter permease [Bacteroidota bacterium]|jgi:lipopolysaccharide transport system permease protein